MAQFCAQAAQAGRPADGVDQGRLPAHDDHRLAAAFGAAATPAARKDGPTENPAPAFPDPSTTRMSRSRPRYLLCGVLQFLWILALPLLWRFVTASGFEWVSASPTLPDIYLRALTFSGIAFVGMCLLPIVAKWLLVGRWKPRQFPVWSLTYFRFWLVKTLIRTSPLVRFVGTPLYPLYLRAARREDRQGRHDPLADRARCAPTCSRSARARSSARTRRSPATARWTA